MHKVNLNDIEERERRSPGGKFGRFTKDISIALGRDPDSLDLRTRHPFDLALARVQPGKAAFTYHSHSAESELYLVVSGRAKVRHKNGWTEIAAGDAFFFAPGEAHQLVNSGKEDFIYYIIADNPRGDTCHYPDSGKFSAFKQGNEEIIVRAEETDYFDGEE